MKITLALHDGYGLESVKFVTRSIVDALCMRHDVRVAPDGQEFTARNQMSDAVAQCVTDCDVIVGFPMKLGSLLQARAQTTTRPPCIVFALGALPAGAASLGQLLPYLDTDDVIVVNSRADLALARKFFDNARVSLLPLPYDDDVFQVPSALDRQKGRRALGCSERSHILLYAGRITIEKNLHSVLRIFAVINRRLPDAHLIIAGAAGNVPFSEMGVYPIDYRRTLARISETLGLTSERLHIMGAVSRNRLAELYGVADALINMTLHHDENFGLAQVEASACGTPVIGTAWGGLRDTIRAGVNGDKVGTRVTPLGVKVNWWEAVNKAMLLLTRTSGTDDERRHIVASACNDYGPAAFRRGLEELVHLVSTGKRGAAEPLRRSEFAALFWALCCSEAHPHARYARDDHSFDLYRELIENYTEPSEEWLDPREHLEATQVLVLLMPVTRVSPGLYAVEDPLYPLLEEVPERLVAPVDTILAALAERELMTIGRLTEEYLPMGPLTAEALCWLSMRGFVARTECVRHWLTPECLGQPLTHWPFRCQMADMRNVDAIVTTDSSILPRFS